MSSTDDEVSDEVSDTVSDDDTIKSILYTSVCESRYLVCLPNRLEPSDTLLDALAEAGCVCVDPNQFPYYGGISRCGWTMIWDESCWYTLFRLVQPVRRPSWIVVAVSHGVFVHGPVHSYEEVESLVAEYAEEGASVYVRDCNDTERATQVL